MTAPPTWTTKISSYLEDLEVTDSLGDDDFDFDFDDDYAPEFEDEWDEMKEYTPDKPLPVKS